MQPLTRIKHDLEFNKNLDELVAVLKMTTSLQLRQFQSQHLGDERFLREIYSSFEIIERDEITKHPLFNRASLSPKAIVVITSDEGFLGELNALLINAGLHERKSEKDELIVLGAKGAQYLQDINQSYLYFSGVSERIGYKEADNLKRYLIDEYLKGVFNQVYIIYAESVSITAQHVKIQQLLPFSMNEIGNLSSRCDYYKHLLTEPDTGALIDELISMVLGFMLYRIFYYSKLAEFSARLMHLEKSSQELVQLGQELSLEYCKSMHSRADTQIREMLSSRIVINK